jgi:cyclin-dependent kinase 7
MDENHAILKQTVGDNTGKSEQAMSLDFSVFGLKPPNRPTINR